MRHLLKRVLRHRRLAAYLREVYLEAKLEQPGGSLPETAIPEAQPVQCRPSDLHEPRLNLLVPSLAIQHVFGGISTALAVFKEFGQRYSNLRIILTEQQHFSSESNPNYGDWEIRSLDDPDKPGIAIIPAGDRAGRTLPVSPHDRFIATAWWTACSARHMQSWQAEYYRLATKARYVYLIQDYEPGFYPWSSRFALAEATYGNPDDFVAVFNTHILKEYFLSEGYRFPFSCSFDPTLHPVLQKYLQDKGEYQTKERRILVYGRPSVERNAFQLIVMALRRWASAHPDLDWEIVSAGETHPPIDLGHGKKLVSLGKLSLESYAQELSQAAVGISLMISPHPSYPPLEMAAFGINVITNTYKSKDLSSLNPRIYSVKSLDPETIAEAIDCCIRNAKQAGIESCSVSETPEWRAYITSNSNFDLLSTEISSLLGLTEH